MHTLGNRRHLTRPVKQQLLTMTKYMSTNEIAAVTETGSRTIRRIKQLYAHTGDVTTHPIVGRPRLLDALDVEV
jgi:transposase